MEIGALLKSFIYLVSASLLYPVLALLFIMTLGTIVYGGAFFAEWLERARLTRQPAQKLPELILGGRYDSTLPHRVRSFIEVLQGLPKENGTPAQVEVENLIRDRSIHAGRNLDRLRMFVRIAPGLGLIGTLIPMGTGLAALGQGDMTKLSSDLVIAFTTTVVGLAIGMATFFFYTVKRRWVEEDLKNIELAAELLAAGPKGDAA